MMCKALLLQSGYALSDPALQKQWAHELLFRRFTGLDMSEPVPDHASFWRVRQTLDTLSLMDGLLGEMNIPLQEQGVYIQSGDADKVARLKPVH